MTSKQRAKIYRKAAEMIFNKVYLSCCPCIAEIHFGNEMLYTHVREKDFKEFFIFQQPDKWWWKFMGDTEPRIIALLLSEQMALNP